MNNPLFGGKKKTENKVNDIESLTVFKGAKQSKEFDDSYLSNYSFLPRRAYENIDLTELLESRYLTAGQILTILSDIDSDVSMAVWNFLRMIKGEWSVSVYNQGSETINVKGQKAVDIFLKGINKGSGGINSILSKMILSLILQGALSAEAILDENGKKVVGLSPINPSTIYFKEININGVDTIKPHQYQTKIDKEKNTESGNYVVMNPLTFWYIPLDPAVGDPYGRSPLSAAVGDVLFNLKIMYDLRKVVHNQGWPRIDLTVATEVIKNLASEDIQRDAKKLDSFIRNVFNDLKYDYDNLKPDDTFIHTDAVQINDQGAANKSAFDPTALLRAIERRIIRGLKQLPILMGSNEGTTESHGGIQLEVFTRGIAEIQMVLEEMMEEFLELHLRFEGIQASVEFEFETISTKDRLAEAQAEAVEINNEILKVSNGWVSNNDASIAITGSKAVAEIEKIAPVNLGGNPAPTGGNNLNSRSIKKTSLDVLAKQEDSCKKKLKRMAFNAFSDLEKALDSEGLSNELYETYPISTKKNNKIDYSNPIYNTVLDLVNKYFDDETTKNILQNMSEEGGQYLVDAFNIAGQGMIFQLNKENPAFRYDVFRLNDYGLERLIDERAKFFPQSVYETTKKDIATTVVNGYKEAKTVKEIARDIRDKFEDMKVNRADLIANTELRWASSQGSLATMRKNGVSKKIWQTVNDGRVDEECILAQEQGKINADSAFVNGFDAPPAHPRCRCSVSAAVDDDWEVPAEIWLGGNDK